MAKKSKADIVYIRSDKTDRIIEFRAKKIVTPSGTGAHVPVPRELIGKIVEIHYKEESGKEIKKIK